MVLVRPNSLSSASTPGGDVKDIKLSKDERIIFAAAGNNGIEIYDVSDILSPTLLTGLNSATNASNITLSNNEQFAYVSSG